MRPPAAALFAFVVLAAAACQSPPQLLPLEDMNTYGKDVAAPPPDPDRRVNEKDCTRPTNAGGGNLKCM